MSSAAARHSANDRRPSAQPDDNPRSRMNAQPSFRTDRADSRQNPSPQSSANQQRQHQQQPQQQQQQQDYQSAPHKRTASGNPRTADDRRTEERRTEIRTTERTYVTHHEALIARNRSSERQRPREKAERRGESAKQKQPEPRPREIKPDAPQAPWNPEATLTPHTSAPLASRISIPPLASQAPAAQQPKPLTELSLEAQEAAMIEDLLFTFMGYEGQYIRFAKTYNPHEERDRLTGPTFRILPGLDPSLQDLTASMLRLATYYSALEAFVDVQSREEFGSVNHALCAAVRKHLQDYLVLVAQLETQFLTNETFTIHLLNVHTLSTRQMMIQLYSLAHELLKKNALLDDESDESSSDSGDDFENILESLREGGELAPGNMTGKKICKGGMVLGMITRRLETMSGDPSARALLTALLRDASRPYMVMLNEWLHHGAIKDPQSEFLIKEQKSIKRERLEQDYTDEYWERRYTIREQDVPPQLEGVKDKVLLAGKYLNVVRECGGVDVSKEVRDVPTSFDDSRFLENVNGAYAHANESLMQLLLTTHALPDRLRSLKHYFFLDPSDYFSYFLELGASELKKPVKSVNTGKLQSLLDLVLRQPGSAVSMDPFKEDVKVEMNEITLTKSLQRVVNITGIEQGETLQPLAANQPVEGDKNAIGFTSLQLDYAVPFPVSLVISRKTIWRYQALFRYLLSLRFLESQLSTTWHAQIRGVAWAHRGSNRGLEAWKRRVWTLRARMLVFVQQLLYFCTAEVIEPNWQKFMSRLKARDEGAAEEGITRTVDELMQDHVDFLDTCLKECMLTNSKLLRIHSKLMQTCTIFATHTNWLSRELQKSDPELSSPTAKPRAMSIPEWRRLQALRSSTSASAAAAAEASSAAAAVDPEKRVAELGEIMRKYEGNFSRHLQILLDALNHYAATETVVLLSLCARLSAANHGTEYAGLRNDAEGV